MKYLSILSLLFLTSCADKEGDIEFPSCYDYADPWPNDNIEIYPARNPLIYGEFRPLCKFGESRCEVETIGEKHLNFYCE
jgi:hypothetical protein